jgi:GntR family transcriptional regulator / MocR family aminotransferase
LQAVIELPHGTERFAVEAAARLGLAVSGLAEYRYEPAGYERSESKDALVVGYASPSDSAWGGALETLCQVLSSVSYTQE